MYGKSTALSSYGRVANSDNDPVQQIVMLYDGAIKFLRLAAENIESKDIPKKGEHVNRALDIINYLQGILDFERGGDVAPTLDKLYTLVSMKALQASAKLDANAMRGAANLLAPVRESWNQISTTEKTQVQEAASSASPRARLGQLVLA